MITFAWDFTLPRDQICMIQQEIPFIFDTQQFSHTSLTVVSSKASYTWACVGIDTICTWTTILARIWVTIIYVWKNVFTILLYWNYSVNKSGKSTWDQTSRREVKALKDILNILHTCLTICTSIARQTWAGIGVDPICACSSILTRVWIAIVYV